MKKIISVFICLVLLATTCLSLASCKSKDYEEALSLLECGKYEEAKAIFEELGDYKDSKNYLSGFRHMVTGMTYQANGETGTITISLDKNNLPVRLSLVNGELNNAYVFVYGDDGRIIRDEMLSNGGDPIVTDYTYNANGYITKSVCSFPDGTQIISEYTYDAKGNETKEVSTFGESVTVTDYTYDEKGNLLLKVRDSGDGDQSTTRYTYDESGKKLKETYEGFGGYGYVIDYTYNANGYLVKEVVTEDGEIQLTTEYTYDANGNIIKKVSTDAAGNQSILEAQYALVYIPFMLPEETEDVLKAFWDII